MTVPLCPYFGKCGGCSSQHIDYNLQLENKKKVVARLYNEVQVFSGNEYHYRNRMDFIFHKNGLGFREKNRWYKVVDIESCVISNERLNIFLKEIRSYFKDVDYFDLNRHTGTFKFAVIRTPRNDSSISFVLNDKSTRLAEAINTIRVFSERSTASNILVTYIAPESEASVSENYFVVKGRDFLEEKFLGKKFYYPVQGFFQNNSEMAEKMLSYVHNVLKGYSTKESYLLDLYGGVGVFGIVNADLFKQVTTIESFKPSVDAAIKNIRKQSNIRVILLDASQLRKIEFGKPLYIITDPPRTGMDQKTIHSINELRPEVLVYISCNPQQLAKDLAKIKNYKIKSLAMFDMFPQTPHIESVVELVAV